MSLLDPGFNLTLRPMKYPQFFDMYKQGIANTWTVDDLDFTQDIAQLHNGDLTPDQVHMVKRLVAFFATGDTIVANNLVLTLYQHLNSPEARMYLMRQGFEECFAEGTEILTEEGWVDFKDLEDQKVAQFDPVTSEVSFVLPERKIRYNYVGPMVEFEGQRVHQKVTPNHRMVYKRYGDKAYRFKEASKFSASRNNKIPVAGRKLSGRTSLTAKERFLIALQADGTIITHNHTTGAKYTGALCGTVPVRFTLTQKRKIERLHSLLDSLGWQYSRKKRVTSISVPVEEFLSKNFDWVKLSEVSAEWAEEFLEEILHWDGSKSGGAKRYCTTNESCYKVVQALGAICGKRCSNNQNSLPSGKTYYQPTIVSKDTVVSDVVKREVAYDGEVFCVTVPTGAIIVRSNEHVSVSGNCLHIETYLLLLDNYIPNMAEREAMFDAVNNIPSIALKAEFADKYTNLSKDADLTDKLQRKKFLLTQMCFAACIEGLFFYAAFAYVYWLRSMGLLVGLADATNYVFKDETCVDGETELLTESGWVNIKDVTTSDRVAQFDTETREISFVAPIRKIAKSYTGEMVSFQHKKGGINQILTADHDVVQRWNYQKTYRKQKAIDFKPNTIKKIPVTGFKRGRLKELSWEDRLRIAFQADGSLSDRYDGSRCGTLPLQISLKKERKKDRLRTILGRLPFTYTETETTGRAGFTKFVVNVPVAFAPSKSLEWAQSRIPEASAEWCEAFIQEVAEWDGHRPKVSRKSSVIYSNNSLESVEVVQQIATLCGRHATINRNQKKGYAVTYRLFMQEKLDASTGTLQKEVYEDSLDVYCVTVPTGAIVIRRGEKVSVTGNCHMEFGYSCIRTIRKEDPYLFDEDLEADVRAMLKEAVECEMQFAEDILAGADLPGLTLEDMRSYLEYTACQRYEDLGYTSDWLGSDGNPVKQPFDFMNLQGMDSLTDFFSRRVTDYKKGLTGTVRFDADF